MNQDDIIIPQFKGHSNWIEFKNESILKISLIKSVTSSSLDYIVDTTKGEYKSARPGKGEIKAYDSSDLESMKSKPIFFDEAFKKDNLQFKKIGTQSPRNSWL